ncbi:alpha/beta fold hydrolase [Thiotrichales bacterium 19S9-12]|nr:alpha/beta fold hydrolase [Thiotrichales bacterium 19S9-11]MCF6811637.1 alpha/beta fold hydrolase [Thiotrichales bacterium 19S9-12]
MNTYQNHLSQIKTLNLSDYVKLTKQYIKEFSDINNSPFFLQGKPNAPLVILTHGFSSSAYAMRSLAYQLNEQGYHCFAPLLLGHGTQPQALLNIPYQNWLDQIEHFILSAQQTFPKIHLIGHSYGGLLSTLMALKYPALIKSLILFAPAFELSSPLITALLPYISLLGKVIPLKFLTKVQSLCGNDRFSYHEFPMQAAVEVLKHIKHVKLDLKAHITQPVFMAISTDDETVSSKAALNYFYHNNNIKSHCVIYTRANDFYCHDPRVEIISSNKLCSQVIDFSHLGMHIDINDPHYGINGHYYHNDKPYPITFGAMNYRNKLKIKNLKRLAFNPNFNLLSKKIIEFIDHAN